MSEPVAGNHNDLYNIEVRFDVVTATLELDDIPVDGLFLNADAGLGPKDFRRSCGNKEINANICFNERNWNADRDEYLQGALWRTICGGKHQCMDSYRSLPNRLDTTTESWKGFNYLAFIVIALKKFKKKKRRKKFKQLR